MAKPSTVMIMILAASLGAWLPAVTPIDFNTCAGGSVPTTCGIESSSHCCKSGTYLSATCCQNTCISRPKNWWSSTPTSTCYDITESMCCSWSKYGPQACCNHASYLRTSVSIVNGDTPYMACSGGIRTEYCNMLSTSCCSSGYYASATCCRESICTGVDYIQPCHGTSTYCCSSSHDQSCCDYSDYISHYNYEKYQRDNSAGGIAGGVFGGIILLVIIIVVPVSVVCCCGRRREQDQADTTAPSGTAASNHSQPRPAFQQLAFQYQPPPNEQQQPSPSGFDQPPSSWNEPPPYEHRQQPPTSVFDQQPTNGDQPPSYEHHQPPSSGLDQPPANGNQPPSNEHYQPLSSGCDQPPAYDSLSQYQAPLAPPTQPGPGIVTVVSCKPLGPK